MEEFIDSVDAVDAFRISGQIEFARLWTIFPPKTPVLVWEHGTEQVMRLRAIVPSDSENSTSESSLLPAGEQVDWNGSSTGSSKPWKSRDIKG